MIRIMKRQSYPGILISRITYHHKLVGSSLTYHIPHSRENHSQYFRLFSPELLTQSVAQHQENNPIHQEQVCRSSEQVCPAVVQAVIFLSLYLITGRKNFLAGLVIYNLSMVQLSKPKYSLMNGLDLPLACCVMFDQALNLLLPVIFSF